MHHILDRFRATGFVCLWVRIHNGNVLRACQPKSVFLALQSTKEDKTFQNTLSGVSYPLLRGRHGPSEVSQGVMVEISFCHDPGFSCSVIFSCYILKLCPHVSCVAFHFLCLCDFPTSSVCSVPFLTVCTSLMFLVFSWISMFALNSWILSASRMFPQFSPTLLL